MGKFIFQTEIHYLKLSYCGFITLCLFIQSLLNSVKVVVGMGLSLAWFKFGVSEVCTWVHKILASVAWVEILTRVALVVLT